MPDDWNEPPPTITPRTGLAELAIELEPEPEPEPAPQPEPPAVGEPKPSDEPTRTPAQWAERLGHIKHGDARIPQSETFADWQHAAADKLHGWSKHAYHYANDPLLMTEADYKTALENAAEYPLKQAHEAALSPLLKPKEKV